MKNNKYYLFTAILGLILIFSCAQLSQEERKYDALMQKIIDVHDEVMPKMGEISSLIKDLDNKIDTTSVGQSHQKAQNDLKDSYDFMMDWMNDFSSKFPHDEEITNDDIEKFNTKLKLLEEEEIKVNKLKNQINSSIDQAKKLLKKS